MSEFDACAASPRDPVELLLRRIAGRALRGALLTSAVVTPACGNEDTAAPRDELRGPTTASVDAAITATSAADATTVVDAASGADAGDARTDVPPEPPPAGSYDPCVHGPGFPVRAEGLRLAAAADYVAVRTGFGNYRGREPAPAPERWTATRFDVESETGEACATATGAECASQVAHHPDVLVQPHCPQACIERSVVTTRGDEVKRWATPDALRELLGPIDAPDDALMIATANGYDVSCPAQNEVDSPLSPKGSRERYVRSVEGGYELVASSYAATCPVVVRLSTLSVSTAGAVQVLASKDFPSDGVCIGRVPAGLTSRAAAQTRNAFGDHLAQCAHLESASVHAFVRLAEELRAHGAPPTLIERALEAARDEVRHAQVIAALARLHDGLPSEPEVDALPVRSLEEIARENAVEGCVRETYGAIVGAYQAERAADLPLRAAMRRIAADESRHAALSHAVHAWLMPQLDASARERIRDAQHAMLDALHGECTRDEDAAVRDQAGLPDARTARAMLAELARELWQRPLHSAA
jgi:hypothetical protein